jgi:hypothetical protein
LLAAAPGAGAPEAAAEVAAARRAHGRPGDAGTGETEFDDAARPFDTTDWFNR